VLQVLQWCVCCWLLLLLLLLLSFPSQQQCLHVTRLNAKGSSNTALEVLDALLGGSGGQGGKARCVRAYIDQTL
jgi:hypothetical protein